MPAINFHPSAEPGLDDADTGILRADASSADIDGLVDLLRTKNSFLKEDDIRGASNHEQQSTPNNAQNERQSTDFDLLQHLATPVPSASSQDDTPTEGPSRETRDMYLKQIKQCFKFLLDSNPPDYVKLPVLQMLSNEMQTGGIKWDNRDYYYATIWQLVRFMSYITCQSDHLMSVSTILSEKHAYAVAARILVSYIRDFGFELDRTWTFALEHPQVISDSVSENLAKDIVSSAKFTGKFALRASNYTGRRPPRIQNTPITLRAKTFAQFADSQYHELRKPFQESRMNEEILGAVVTAIRAVDKRLGVSRTDAQYADAVEAMYRIPVAALDEELLTMGAINLDTEQYGSLHVGETDSLCAVGYYRTTFSHRSKDTLPMAKIPPDGFVESMQWEGNRVAKFVMKSSHEQVFMWNYPIRETSLLEGVSIIFANDYGLRLISLCRDEEARLDDITEGLAKEIFNCTDSVEAPYCGMQGALGLGYIISKGFRSFEPIEIVDDAVALAEYAQIRQEIQALRGGGLQLCTASLRIYDLETLALPRVVDRQPANMKVGLYLAAIKLATNAADIGASEISYKRPVALPDLDDRNSSALSFWANIEDDGKSIETALRAKIRQSEVELNHLRGVRNGKILAKSSLPFDVFVVIIAALALAIIPSILRSDDDAAQRISNAIQNVGIGAFPIIAVYIVIFYFRWGPYDMLRAQRSCATLEEAAKSAGVSVVSIAEELARKGWASEVLATAGAGLPLRGAIGNGFISCGVGLSLTEYCKLGLIVLKKDGVMARIIGRDFSLQLNRHAETGIWHVSKAEPMGGFFTEASEEDIHILVG